MAMPIPSDHSCPDTDVLVMGDGAAPQVLAILLAQRGWLTTLAAPSPRAFPRVVGLDAATVRVLSNCGIGAALAGIGVSGTELEFCSPVLRFRRGPFTMFHESALESALRARAARLPNLRLLRDSPAFLLVDHGRYAESTVGGEVLTSSWIVSCDGRHHFHGPAGSWRSGRILLPVRASIQDAATLAWQLPGITRPHPLSARQLRLRRPAPSSRHRADPGRVRPARRRPRPRLRPAGPERRPRGTGCGPSRVPGRHRHQGRAGAPRRISTFFPRRC